MQENYGRKEEKEMKQETDLGSGSVGKLLFQLSLPAITAQLINLLYNMVDRMYIGHIPGTGAQALTGVGVTMPVIMTISAFAALVSMGGAPRASIMLGQGNKEKAEKILGNCTTLLILLSLSLTLVIQLWGKPLLMIFGASENTIGYAMDYIKIYSLGTIFVHLAMGLNAFITAQGFAKISMYSVLLGAVCNIVLDPVFIFGFDMGVKGAALATILSQGVSTVWVVWFLTRGKSGLKIKRKNMALEADTILPCLALGLSPFIMQFTESIVSVCFNTSLLKYGGDIAVGSMTILNSVMQFSMLPLVGLTQGSQPIVSYNYGAKKPERIKAVFRLLLTCCLLYSTFIWAISMFVPQLPIALFTSTQELADYSRKAIRVYMAMSLIFGAQNACQQTFVALGNAKASVFLALLRKVFLLMPFIYILPHFFEDKAMAVFLAEPVADTIAVTVTVTMFFRAFKKAMKELESGKE